jgi:hypothetical protein
LENISVVRLFSYVRQNLVYDNLFLPEFIHRFLPDRKSLELILDNRFFSRERRLSLEVTLALVLNLVRPGERVGYQKAIDQDSHDGSSPAT